MPKGLMPRSVVLQDAAIGRPLLRLLSSLQGRSVAIGLRGSYGRRLGLRARADVCWYQHTAEACLFKTEGSSIVMLCCAIIAVEWSRSEVPGDACRHKENQLLIQLTDLLPRLIGPASMQTLKSSKHSPSPDHYCQQVRWSTVKGCHHHAAALFMSD